MRRSNINIEIKSIQMKRSKEAKEKQRSRKKGKKKKESKHVSCLILCVNLTRLLCLVVWLYTSLDVAVNTFSDVINIYSQ